MAKKENSPESGESVPPPVLGNVLRWIATTAGLSGILATTGYIVHFSQEDLLGISLDARASTASFVLDGARFFTDLGMFFLSAAPDLIIALITLVVFLLLLAAIKRFTPEHTQIRIRKHIPVWTYPLFLLIAVVAESAWYDLPTMYIQNVLFRPVKVSSDIGLSQSLPTQLKDRVVSLRNAVICSRADIQGCTDNTTANKRYLERWFSLNLVISVFLLVLGLRALTAQPLDSSGTPRHLVPVLSPLGLFLSLALLLNLFGIPFVYAKTVKPTRFMDAEIVFKKSGGAKQIDLPSTKSLAPSASEGQKPTDQANNADADQLAATLSLTQWYILSEDADRLTLYNQDRTQIWSIPKIDLQVIEIVGEGDVLETHFLEWYNNYGKENKDGSKT